MVEEQMVADGMSGDTGQSATANTAGQTVATAAVMGSAIPQLTQVRVPLDEAAEAMATPDATGRLPIVVVPTHPFRIRNELVIAGATAPIRADREGDGGLVEGSALSPRRPLAWSAVDSA